MGSGQRARPRGLGCAEGGEAQEEEFQARRGRRSSRTPSTLGPGRGGDCGGKKLQKGDFQRACVEESTGKPATCQGGEGGPGGW